MTATGRDTLVVVAQDRHPQHVPRLRFDNLAIGVIT